MIRASRVLSLARNRRVVRRFADRPVPADALATVLECGRYAPSAKEAQPWRFVVVQEALTRLRLASAAFNHPHVRTAPTLIVCTARVHTHVSGSGRPSYPVDLAAATQSMLLAASDLGLTSSWITGFRERTVREILEMPTDVPIVSMLALGYPEGLGPLPERLRRREVIVWERWQDSGEGTTAE